MPLTDPTAIAIIGFAFLLAGTIKGLVGLGLPPVSLGILVLAFDLPTAIALTLAPSFASNIWQACVGGRAKVLAKRLWPMLLPATGFIFLGALALKQADGDLLTAVLGIVILVYAGLNLAGVQFKIGPGQETWAGPLFGTINGVISGMTGVSSMPSTGYFQAIGLERDELVQALGLVFILSAIALIIAMQGQGLLNANLAIASVGAAVPTLIGMRTGQAIRAKLSPETFKRVFLIALFLLGAFITGRALLG